MSSKKSKKSALPIFNLIHVPNDILHRKTQEIALQALPDASTEGADDKIVDRLVDRRTQKYINRMIATLEAARNPEGVGLAANQVGLSIALFIMKPSRGEPATVCINPKILEIVDTSQDHVEKPHTDIKKIASQAQNELDNSERPQSEAKSADDGQSLEGCLSIPKIWGSVRRAEKVKLSYYDEVGKYTERWFEGFEAIIVQHEMDHLNGILFTQRVLEQKRQLFRETSDGKYLPYKI